MKQTRSRKHRRIQNCLVIAKDLPRHWGEYGRSIFMDLLGLANEERSSIRFRGRRFWLPPGGLPIGWITTAELLGVNKNTLKKYVRMFAEEGVIRLMSDNRGTVIIFKNYLKYQSLLLLEGQKVGQPMTPQISHSLLEKTVSEKIEEMPVEPPLLEPVAPVVPEEVRTMVQVFNDSRPDTCPPVDPNYLKPKVIQNAMRLWKRCTPELFAKIVRKTALSLWLTGQVRGSTTGLYFDVATLFDFVCQPGKARFVLAGEYDYKPLGKSPASLPPSKHTSLHNGTSATRSVKECGRQTDVPRPATDRVPEGLPASIVELQKLPRQSMIPEDSKRFLEQLKGENRIQIDPMAHEYRFRKENGQYESFLKQVGPNQWKGIEKRT